MLLYHPLRKTYDDFEGQEYCFDDSESTLIETDRQIVPGDIIILRDIADYAIVVTNVWEQDGKRYFSHKSAENIIVRARTPRNRD